MTTGAGATPGSLRLTARPGPAPTDAPGLEGTEMNLQLRPISSSLGKKYLMAVTGLRLLGFVLAHMAGNLLVFAGRDALNSYARALKDRPALLWAARAGLAL